MIPVKLLLDYQMKFYVIPIERVDEFYRLNQEANKGDYPEQIKFSDTFNGYLFDDKTEIYLEK